MTIRKQILIKAATAAGQAPSLQSDDGPKVHRSRSVAIARNESPALIIRPSDESVNSLNDLAERDFYFELIVIARGEIPDDVADEVIGEVHELICKDPGFGGLALGLYEIGSNWMFAAADESAVELTVRYRVRLYTQENSLAEFPS